MIHYDSHKWRTLIKFHGSVLPKALLWATPSALIAVGLKYMENEGFYSLGNLTELAEGNIYSGFTFVLGFSLVFRTSQSYLRYWTAATSVHEMGSEWSDSVASLIAFATISKSSYIEILKFRHTVVRLFSLLHAMALSEIASIGQDLPLLDIEGLTKQQLMILTSELAQGRKVQIVLSWIKAYIMQMVDRGLLTVPAPILTRVFQELGAGLVNFHKAQQIVIWPFPFPYTQLNLLLIQVYTVITPLVISTWRAPFWVLGIFTFISVTCMIGLDLIASELENPFGDDPNDLPVVDMQGDMNKFLTMQLNPAIHNPPELTQHAQLDYRKLIFQCTQELQRMSLDQRLTRGDSMLSSTPNGMQDMKSSLSDGLALGAGKIASASKRGDRLRAQMRWKGAVTPDSEVKNMQDWLQCGQRTMAVHETHLPELFPPDEEQEQDLDEEGFVANPSYLAEAPSVPLDSVQSTSFPRYRESQLRRAMFNTSVTSRQSSPPGCLSPGMPQSDWGKFLSALHEELREHLDNQLDMQQKELSAIEAALGCPGKLQRNRDGYSCTISRASGARSNNETQLASDSMSETASPRVDVETTSCTNCLTQHRPRFRPAQPKTVTCPDPAWLQPAPQTEDP